MKIDPQDERRVLPAAPNAANIRPVEAGKRLRDLRPGDAVIVLDKPAKVLRFIGNANDRLRLCGGSLLFGSITYLYLWLACHSTDEIAKEVGCNKAYVTTVCFRNAAEGEQPD